MVIAWATVASVLIGATLALPGVGALPSNASSPGWVFTETNAAAGNAVLAFARSPDGTLAAAGSWSTGGLGAGSGLGSQGAVALSHDGRYLFAVNAGSNSVTAFRVMAGSLALAGMVDSGGIHPISVTVHESWVYVLNAGAGGSIAGFGMSSDGLMAAIPGSVRPLSGGATPAEIAFSPSGGVLVVTEKATNTIDTYTVDGTGVASGPMSHASVGTTPFGFAFDAEGRLFVSEVGPGAGGASASSYAVGADGSVAVISGAVPNGQTAACWLMVTPNGHYAYTANTPNNDFSSYRIGDDGSLTLVSAVAATGAGPGDMAVSRDGRFLYAVMGGSGSITGFHVGNDGSLAWVTSATGLPRGVVGLAAR